MSGSTLTGMLADGRRNAVAAWLLVALAAAVWVGELVVAGVLWSTFALVVVSLAVLPPIAYRSRYVMLPWEVLALATLPLIGLVLGAERFSGPLFAYLALAAVGLVIAVELDAFTSIRMSSGFAIVLVVAGTMAAAAVWELLQWYAAVLLERPYETTNDELMIEFAYSTLAGVAAGAIFRWYFRERVSIDDRIPPEARGRVDG
ncbi:hypothetical protein [Saliphagus infecundisoli]|uniref:Uncharacterized protein n=1 Tax=Saliphagus infecundisoli TaxID=1849069 RepID=A0ABD5QED1_9EURY|nr:hypothetical protein [Saliphagus infecundisoli]